MKCLSPGCISTGCTLTPHLCRNVRTKRTMRTKSARCGCVSLRKGRSWVGWVQISPLFHEDDQDDQILIDHLAWVVAKARMRAQEDALSAPCSPRAPSRGARNAADRL